MEVHFEGREFVFGGKRGGYFIADWPYNKIVMRFLRDMNILAGREFPQTFESLIRIGIYIESYAARDRSSESNHRHTELVERAPVPKHHQATLETSNQAPLRY